MTKYAVPSARRPKSKMSTMPSWRMALTARASSKKRADGGVVARELGVQHLDGDALPISRMHRAIDRAHAAVADEPGQLVVAKSFAGGERLHPYGRMTHARKIWIGCSPLR